MDVLIELKSAKKTLVYSPMTCVISRSVCNENLQHEESSAQIELSYDIELFELFIANKTVDAQIKKSDKTVLFTGVITTDLSWTDNGEMAEIDKFSLIINDNTIKLNKKTETEIALENTTLQVIVTELCQKCGIEPDKSLADISIPLFVIQSDRTFLSVFDTLFFNYGYSFYFDETGKMLFFDFKKPPEKLLIANEDTILSSSFKVSKSNKNYGKVKLTYNKLTFKKNELLFFDGAGYDSQNKPSPIILQTGIHYPFESDPRIEKDEGKVYQTFASGYASSKTKYNGEIEYLRSKDTKLIYSKNHDVEQDWDEGVVIERAEFESLRSAVRLKNTTSEDKKVYKFAVRADTYFRDIFGDVSASDKSGGDEEYSSELEFVFDTNMAEQTARALLPFYVKGNYKIDFASETEYKQGTYLNLDSGTTGMSVKALLRSSTFDFSLEKFTYKALSVSDVVIDVSKSKVSSGNLGDAVYKDVSDIEDTLNNGDNPNALPPDTVTSVSAVAWKDSVHISWNYQAKPGLTNTIRKYIIEISKDNGITWGRHNSSEASFIYQFNRKTDGYPEKTDLASWLVQVKAVNIYGKESIEWSSSSGIDTSDYKTWKLAPVSIKAAALKDMIEINWNKQDDVYGAIVYDVYVKGVLSTHITQNQYTYNFNRKIDGYPEKTDLKEWEIKIIARNEAGRTSSVMPPAAFDLTNYKTWKLIPLAANATAYRDNIIVEYEKASDAIYGTVEYNVFVNGGNSGPSYYFNREIDGYPEKSELEAWEIKVVTSNPAMSMQTVLQGVDFDFTDYKTWKPSKPSITAKAISTGVEVSWAVYDGSYYGTPVYSIFKNAQKIKTSLYQSPYTYYFNRKSDGYPEVADMENFKFAVQVVNESGKNAVSEEIVADTTEYKTWHITPPVVTAKADEGLVLVGWEAKPSAETAAYYYGNPTYDVLRGDIVIAANIFANTFDYYFNAEEEGYPEADELALWQFTVRVRTEAEQLDTAPITPDVLSYKGYTPSLPSFTAVVNGRSITLSWKPDTGCYGYTGAQLQVAKAYKVIDGDYAAITDPDELLWFSPALGLNPYASLENYKTGDEGGTLLSEGGTITFTVPLFGQDGTGANTETQYAYRLASQTVAKRSGWTTEHYCLARGVSAYDVVKAWDLSDTGEKIQLDGALGVYQIFVKELAALSANLGLITDGNIVGSEENYWAVSDFIDDTTKEIIRHKGEFRVGGKDKYIKVKPVVENGVVTDYDIDFVVGKFSVSATGTKIEGGYFVVYDRDNNLLFEITPEGIKSRVNEGYLEDTGVISKEIDVTSYSQVMSVLKHGEKVYSIISEDGKLNLVSIDSDNTVLIEDTFAALYGAPMQYSFGYDGESITFLLNLDDTDPLIIQCTYCKYNLTTKSKTYMYLTEERGTYPVLITKTGVVAFNGDTSTPAYYYDFTVQNKVLFPSVFANYDMLSGFTEDSQFLYFPIYGDYATQIIRIDKDSGVPSFCAFHAVKTDDSQLYSDLSKRQMEIDGEKIRFFGDFRLLVDSQTFTSPKQSIIELDFLSLVWYPSEVSIESVRFDVWIAGDRNELEQNFCANTGSGFSYVEASKTLSVYDKIDTPPNETVFYTQKGTLSKISRQIPVNADSLYMFSNVIKEQCENTLYTYLVSDHIKNEGMLMNFQRFWKTTVPITTDKKMYASGIGFTGIFFNKGNGNYRYYLDTGGFLEFSPAGNLVGNGEKGDRGEPGQQGIQGDAGIQGIQGSQGNKGSTGAKGEKGDKGDAGIQGVKGDKGDTGGVDLQTIKNALRDYTIPVNKAIYVQYPGMSAPTDYYAGLGITTWTKVFSGGYFFRTEGGNANPFNGGVQDSKNRLHGHTGGTGSMNRNSSHQHGGSTGSMNRNASHSHSYVTWNRNGGSGQHVSTSYDAYVKNISGLVLPADTNHEHGFSTDWRDINHEHWFSTSSDGGNEANPINQTYIIWKRTA